MGPGRRTPSGNIALATDFENTYGFCDQQHLPARGDAQRFRLASKRSRSPALTNQSELRILRLAWPTAEPPKIFPSTILNGGKRTSVSGRCLGPIVWA